MDTPKKRILIFATTYIPFVGGAEVAIREITKRLPNIDFDIVTTNLDGRQPPKEVIDGCAVYRVGSGRLGKLLFPLTACLLGLRLHEKHTYDAVWSMMASYAGFAGLFFSYRHPRIPFILTLQEGDTAQEIRRKFLFVWPLFRRIFYRAARVQVISQYLGDFTKSIRANASVVVIPNGVSFNEFQQDVSVEVSRLRSELQKTAEDVFLVTTSRLVKKNAVRDIIVALEFLPENIRLVVVGDGVLREQLERDVQDSDVSNRVIFAGEVPHQHILPYLRIGDIFVRPSLSEGFGNSFVEAMAVGIPVIATPVGGIPDFLTDTVTGLFCEIHNPKSIAEQVQRLLDNQTSRNTIVENARTMVREMYDWNLIASRMQKEVFEVVLKNDDKKA